MSYYVEMELSGENIPKTVCIQLWRELRHHSQPPRNFCALYLPRTALMAGALGIFLGISICMCLYLQIFGSTIDINHLALCTFCEDESALQHKGNFSPSCNTELTNMFCTVYRILSDGLLVSCHPCFLIALGKNYSHSCNYYRL